MKIRASIIATMCMYFLAACNPGGQDTSRDSPFAPQGIARGKSVDGLTVGHRLMANGQYELALKSYTRSIGDQGMSVDVLSALGSANLRLGRLGQAERLLRRAIEEDETFVPAWNNLGVVMYERGVYSEAARIFKRAFALDSGNSNEIRDNLRLALAKVENPAYDEQEEKIQLVRRGTGDYLILATP
ncbi:tetratricopeptide repeat protein [Parasulfitobacter algicola]|uniref:Tetratricopeptide repeat protein n=1 Tax=Parasulfitobacter algicola TaxID=2614809 RepID=A0ABX2IZD0_9RHOB|nr:tetratricopeptide repeat protein [Sulfitobacter algicola]NSX56008.1 tetratricopeptide repeat protein [Sulfitobacter algicola]